MATVVYKTIGEDEKVFIVEAKIVTYSDGKAKAYLGKDESELFKQMGISEPYRLSVYDAGALVYQYETAAVQKVTLDPVVEAIEVVDAPPSP
jgi:hypothetical protein